MCRHRLCSKLLHVQKVLRPVNSCCRGCFDCKACSREAGKVCSRDAVEVRAQTSVHTVASYAVSAADCQRSSSHLGCIDHRCNV